MREIDYGMIGKRIKKLREERGLTQQGLCDISGVNTRRISAIENGGSIRLDSFIWLAVALDISTDYIVFGTAAGQGPGAGTDMDALLEALEEIRAVLEAQRRQGISAVS